ncbi:collagen alpha-1(III) chain-like [Chiroxiphia lanceolata]|uniref:collagen alpha-1(III) chain-like n=1 Tax=Chiroxiphia lanceolata TaxID=296741 RepID=UPI0013CE434B|nr:collagen alpha-1(III) chain-like [Chiroxiphia lanceolata]
MPLELRVLPGVLGPPRDPPSDPGSPLGHLGDPPVPPDPLHRPSRAAGTPPERVGGAGGSAGGALCALGPPPPGPYLESSLVFELALSPPGGPPKTVGVPAGRREQLVGGLGGSTPYTSGPAPALMGSATGGSGAPGPPPLPQRPPQTWTRVTLGLSCLLVVLLLGWGHWDAGTPPAPEGEAVAAGARPRAGVRGALQCLRGQLPAVAVPGGGGSLAPPGPPRG